MKNYIGTKIIKAEPMDEDTFFTNFKGEKDPCLEARPGYHVSYPDGYDSWSPKETFETAYREVTKGETDLLLSLD